MGGVCTAKVAEAEVMVEGGLNDFTKFVVLPDPTEGKSEPLTESCRERSEAQICGFSWRVLLVGNPSDRPSNLLLLRPDSRYGYAFG